MLCCLYKANMDNTSFLTQTSITHIFYQIFRKITTNTPKAKTKTYYPAFTRPKSPIPPSVVTNILKLVSVFLPPQQTTVPPRVQADTSSSGRGSLSWGLPDVMLRAMDRQN